MTSTHTKTILIVEDNPSNLKLAKVILEIANYQILTAHNAGKAMELLKTAKPNLILMDIQLPDMSGLQLTQILKSNPKTNDIIIIALTALARKEDELNALNAGCDGYISKPFERIHLLKKIADFLK